MVAGVAEIVEGAALFDRLVVMYTILEGRTRITKRWTTGGYLLLHSVGGMKMLH
jgi:hypothetical protein